MSRIDPAADEPAPDTRDRILAAAAELIAAGGRDAAATRAVAAAASVQAPTIYRLFGDKRGLLDAAAREVAAYMAQKAARAPHQDPVQDLLEGWDAHVAFGAPIQASLSSCMGSRGRRRPRRRSRPGSTSCDGASGPSPWLGACK